MKQIWFIMEGLKDPMRGIYWQWIYYSDGTSERHEVPKGQIIIPKPLMI